MLPKVPSAWAKITGAPQPGYTKTQLEWSVDVGITEEALEVLKKAGVSLDKYLKPATNPKTGKTHVLNMPYLKFTRRELKEDGSKAKPFKVVDRKGNPWDPDVQIGNGSILNIKFLTNETRNGDIKPSAIAIQVWELNEYAGEDEFPVADGEDW